MRPAEEFAVRSHRTEELDDIRQLLAGAGLPNAGIVDLGDRLVVATRGEEVVGCAGLERYGDAGLLRSVAVAPGARGRGIGARLTAHVLEAATRAGICRVYLLTETAPDFFTRCGFQRIGREAVEPAVQESAEFAELCPASAQAMVWFSQQDAGTSPP